MWCRWFTSADALYGSIHFITTSISSSVSFKGILGTVAGASVPGRGGMAGADISAVSVEEGRNQKASQIQGQVKKNLGPVKTTGLKSCQKVISANPTYDGASEWAKFG
jgi:hypothetical protein